MAGISRSRSKSSARSYKSNRGGAQTDRRMDEPRDEMKPGDREPSPQKNGLKTSRSRSRSRSRGGRYSRSRSRGRSDSRGRSYSRRGRGYRGRSRSRGRGSNSRGRGRSGYGGDGGGRRSFSRGRGRSFPRRRQPPTCKDWLRGDCTYGTRCKFLHEDKGRENRGSYGDRDRKDSGYGSGGGGGGGRGGAETCRDFQRGKCSYGSRCRFRH